ncbi:hypothetical protein TYRP_007634 [Tyrophagus putrescentiae]|nr:hypothetical protein TYRP_007634 [Tyrophagus putrescentiae]
MSPVAFLKEFSSTKRSCALMRSQSALQMAILLVASSIWSVTSFMFLLFSVLLLSIFLIGKSVELFVVI